MFPRHVAIAPGVGVVPSDDGGRGCADPLTAAAHASHVPGSPRRPWWKQETTNPRRPLKPLAKHVSANAVLFVRAPERPPMAQPNKLAVAVDQVEKSAQLTEDLRPGGTLPLQDIAPSSDQNNESS